MAYECPVCGRYYQLTRGRIRRHQRADRQPCPGSGFTPVGVVLQPAEQPVVRDAVETESYKLHAINYAQFLNELKELHGNPPGRTLSRVQWVDSLIRWAEDTDRDARTMDWDELERTRNDGADYLEAAKHQALIEGAPMVDRALRRFAEEESRGTDRRS